MAQKIFFYEGDSVLNELDIKKEFLRTQILSSNLDISFAFCLMISPILMK